jgi:hypothetical protein
MNITSNTLSSRDGRCRPSPAENRPAWNRSGRGQPARSRLFDADKALSGLPFGSAIAATPGTALSRSLDQSPSSSSRRGALGCRVGLAMGKMGFVSRQHRMMSPATSQGANGEPAENPGERTAETPEYRKLLTSCSSSHSDMLSVSNRYMQRRPRQDSRAGAAWCDQGGNRSGGMVCFATLPSRHFHFPFGQP